MTGRLPYIQHTHRHGKAHTQIYIHRALLASRHFFWRHGGCLSTAYDAFHPHTHTQAPPKAQGGRYPRVLHSVGLCVCIYVYPRARHAVPEHCENDFWVEKGGGGVVSHPPAQALLGREISRRDRDFHSPKSSRHIYIYTHSLMPDASETPFLASLPRISPPPPHSLSTIVVPLSARRASFRPPLRYFTVTIVVVAAARRDSLSLIFLHLFCPAAASVEFIAPPPLAMHLRT